MRLIIPGTNISKFFDTTTSISAKNCFPFFICNMVRKKQRRDELLLEMIIHRIKDLRRIHDHTQEQLIEGTNLNIPNMETGENYPNITTLSIICKFYKITLDEFFAPMGYPPKEE